MRLPEILGVNEKRVNVIGLREVCFRPRWHAAKALANYAKEKQNILRKIEEPGYCDEKSRVVEGYGMSTRRIIFRKATGSLPVFVFFTSLFAFAKLARAW